jgi:hypothetical protein
MIKSLRGKPTPDICTARDWKVFCWSSSMWSQRVRSNRRCALIHWSHHQTCVCLDWLVASTSQVFALLLTWVDGIQVQAVPSINIFPFLCHTFTKITEWDQNQTCYKNYDFHFSSSTYGWGLHDKTTLERCLLPVHIRQWYLQTVTETLLDRCPSMQDPPF